MYTLSDAHAQPTATLARAQHAMYKLDSTTMKLLLLTYVHSKYNPYH